MAKKDLKKVEKEPVKEVVEEVKEEVKEEIKEEKPVEDKSFKRLVSANGRDFYVDANGDEIKE